MLSYLQPFYTFIESAYTDLLSFQNFTEELIVVIKNEKENLENNYFKIGSYINEIPASLLFASLAADLRKIIRLTCTREFSLEVAQGILSTIKERIDDLVEKLKMFVSSDSE